MEFFSRQTTLANKGSAKRRTSAFTLVEVVVGLGLIMFALVPIMSLLPVALNTSADSNRVTYTSNIMQQLTNEANLTDYSALDNLATTRYFDDQGFEITGASSSNWTYKAVVTLTSINSAWTQYSNMAYPAQTSSYSPNTRRMQIAVYARSRPDTSSVTNVVLSNQGL
jgi:uncharacterized protein (TIGR02598 family)